MKENFETEKERRRRERDNEIRQRFEELRAQNPLVRAHRLHVRLGEEYSLTSTSIRNIVNR